MVPACNQRDGTVGTVAVTALGNLHVGIVAWCREVSDAIAGRYIGLAEVGQQLLVIELSVELVHLRKLCLQFVLVSLGEASHDVEPVELSVLLPVYKFEDRVDALFLGRLNETAGVDDRNLSLRMFRVVCTMVAVGLELLHDKL